METLIRSFESAEWRWEDMCGPGGLQPWNHETRDMGLCFQRLFMMIPALFLVAVVSSYYVGRRVDWVARGTLQRWAVNLRALAVLSLASVSLFKGYGFVVDDDGKRQVYGVDYFTCGAELIAWTIHFVYLLALRTRLGTSSRGPVVVSVLWCVTAVLSVTTLHTLVVSGKPYSAEAVSLVLQIFYGLTMVPSEGVTSSISYTNIEGSLYSQTDERNPLLYRFINDDGTLGEAFGEVSFMSKLLFYWVNPLFSKGLEKKLKDPDDLFDLPVDVSCGVVSVKFDKALVGNIDKYQNTTNEHIQRIRGSYGSVNNETHSTVSSTQVIVPVRKHNVSLLRALVSCFGFEFFSVGLLKLLADASGFAGPILLNKLINYIEDPQIDVKMGYLYAGGLFVSSIVAAVCDSHFNMFMSVIGLKFRGAIISTVFKKTLSVTTTELNKSFSIGEVTNFISTDTDRIVNSCPSFHALWSIPLQLSVTLYLLYTQVGISFLAGVAFSVALIPINKYVANKIGSLSTNLMKHKDGRVSIMTEIIKNIRTIKLYVWEDYFTDKISEERTSEVKYLKGRKYLDAVCVFFWATTPVIVTTLTLTTYVLLGNELKAATVFTTIALLNMLIAPLNAFPWVLNGMTEAWVSIKRIQGLLNIHNSNETQYETNESLNTERDIVISMYNATFMWASENNRDIPSTSENRRGSDPSDDGILYRTESLAQMIYEDFRAPFCLSDISLEIRRGDFIGVIGKVGSGKTSLLHAIMAEMIKLDGSLWKADNIHGFGYVSQKSWLQRGTIRDNIVFGKAYEESKYRTIINACALTEDLLLLGNNACIGEGGSALSGGQAARIALARAIYQDKQIYLLDDIFSAVDAKVGAHIYRKCVMGLLKYKTRILVTHSLQYLTQADKIVVMENGKIKHQNPLRMILNEFDDISGGFEIGDDDSAIFNSPAQKSASMENILFDDDKSSVSTMDKEISATGKIDFWVIATYWKSIGHWLAFAILLSLVTMQMSRNMTDLWLSYWVNGMATNNDTNVTVQTHVRSSLNVSGDDYKSTRLYEDIDSGAKRGILEMSESRSNDSDQANAITYYLSVYAGFAVLNSMFTLVRAFLFAYGGIHAAVRIHKKLVQVVVTAKMKFFDLTPAGRLLNRFSSDTYTIDDSLPFILNILLAQVFGLLGCICITAYGLPWVSLVIVPLIPIYHYLQYRYRITSRELKRLSSVTLSPIYSHFHDTLEGASIIRAFGRCNQWLQNGEHYVERCQKATLSSIAAAQWLSLRLQLMGCAILTGGAVIAVIQRNFDAINAGFVGLAISYALSITSLLSGVINSFTETEREMIAVERVGEYINDIESEETMTFDETHQASPPYGWPHLGIVNFHNVVMKYRPHLAPSLKNVSFATLPGEKIGVVGRTGAGKSSLFASLFRLSELHSGMISIDSVDISTLSLTTLRSRLSIIPQEPFIFKGSIRQNLDPLEQYADYELWSAVEKCGAKPFILSKGGFQTSADDLSRGHMQLLCLARAVLQNSKILLIDEATANVDQDTDRLIQGTIRCVFRTSTVITIAHRISTVLDSDRIIVMADGEIVEFDKPERLLQDENSYFYQLVSQDNGN